MVLPPQCLCPLRRHDGRADTRSLQREKATSKPFNFHVFSGSHVYRRLFHSATHAQLMKSRCRPIRPALIFFGTACFASSPLQTRPAKRLQFVNYSRFARFAHVGDVSSLEMLAVLLAAFCWVGVPGVSWHPPKIRYAQHTLQPWPKDRPGKEQPWHQLTQPDRTTTIEIQLTACERCAQSCSEATRSVCMCNKLWTSMTENGPCWSHHLLKTAHVSLSLSLNIHICT